MNLSERNETTVMNQRISLEHISNDPLPDTQKREIEVALLELQEESKLIDVTIGQARLALEELQFKSREKKNKISALKGMISPLKNIPNELISKVFEEYAEGLSCPPWILGHICSRWRRIALTTPKLWSNIFIPLRETLPIYSAFDKERALFSRAEKAMISCTLALSQPGPAIFYLLPLFVKYAGQISHLLLDSVDAFVPLLTLPKAEGLLSALERLDLNFSPQNQRILRSVTHAGESPQYNPITLFRHTPRLRSVTIGTSGYRPWTEPSILLLQLPWAQLTCLLFSPILNVRSGNLSAILQLCHNLVQCRFPIPEEELDSTKSTSVELRSLEVLEIMHGYRTGIEYDEHFLGDLFLPSLERLILTSHDGITVQWPLGNITQFISRSDCNIKILHARSFVGKEWILDLLTAMPSLTELLVQGTNALSTILEGMACRDLLPELRYMECRSYVVFDDITHEIVEALGDEGFMENPSDNGTPLSVHIMTNEEGSLVPQLESLQRNWLKVSFECIEGKLYEHECEL